MYDFNLGLGFINTLPLISLPQERPLSSGVQILKTQIKQNKVAKKSDFYYLKHHLVNSFISDYNIYLIDKVQ